MFRPLHRFAVTLPNSLTASGTALDTGTAATILARLPNTGDYTRLTLSSGPAFEFVKATRNGTALVLSRAQEGSVAQPWVVGAALAYELTPQTIIDTQASACGACDDVPVKPLPDGVYQNATLIVQDGAVINVQGGENIIVDGCEDCSQSGSGAAVTAGNGINVSPTQQVSVRVSTAAGNLAEVSAAGVLVKPVFADSATIDFSGMGTPSAPFTGSVIVSPSAGNIIQNTPSGLFGIAVAGNGTSIMDSGDIKRSPGNPTQLFLQSSGVRPVGVEDDIVQGGLVFDYKGRLKTVTPGYKIPGNVTGDAQAFVPVETQPNGDVLIGYNATFTPGQSLAIEVNTDPTTGITKFNTTPGFIKVAIGNTKATVAVDPVTGVATIDAPGRTLVNTDGTFVVDLLTNPNEARLSAGPRTLNGRSIYFNSGTSWSGNGITSTGSTHTITGANFATERWAIWARDANGFPLAVLRTMNTGNFFLYLISSNTVTGVWQFGAFRSATAGDQVIAVLLS